MSNASLIECIAVTLARLRSKADGLTGEANRYAREGYDLWSAEDGGHASGLREACAAIEALLPAKVNADILTT